MNNWQSQYFLHNRLRQQLGEVYTLATAVYAYMVLTSEVCLNRVILLLVYCHLLLLQKKVTKEKEAGKENRYCFSPIAQCNFPLQKTVTVRAFSGLPPHSYNQSNAIVLYPLSLIRFSLR